MSSPAATSPPRPFVARAALWLLETALILGVLALAAATAMSFRMHAINVFGRIIHEFDPWFNFRATEYLERHGLSKFFTWFDHESWYPLGRPVGTTIYPGMQMTSVALYRALTWRGWSDVGRALGVRGLRAALRMSLNDVCVFVPVWFGALATLLVGALTREVSGSWRAGACAALVMAIIPAHLMRSVGGGYDNESVAMTAMCLTFYLWVRALRSPAAWPLGAAAGAAYAYMVAAWGGFIFVGNLVALHAAALVLLGYFSWPLYGAYALFFAVGTAGAVHVPVVGWGPFRSLEQIGPLVVLAGFQYVAACELLAARRGLRWGRDTAAMLTLRLQVALLAGSVAAALLAAVAQTGYFGPLSVRVRSLFIKHTKTGNPLVDSVAEHQPASKEAYWYHLHNALYAVPLGLALAAGGGMAEPARALSGVQVAKWFILLYALVAYFFANKMQRLLILMGPVASALAGIGAAAAIEWALAQLAGLPALLSGGADAAAAPAAKVAEPEAPAAAKAAKAAAAAKQGKAPAATPGKGAAAASPAPPAEVGLSLYADVLALFAPAAASLRGVYASLPVRFLRVAAALALLYVGAGKAREFYAYSDSYARQVSQPSIMFKGKLNDGSEVMINDYVEAYHWLRDNTPRDARVLSWWDYGYQIAGIANRTTLADGNTWNLEHIALIGKMLVSPEKKAHALARHLADYVLIWGGNQGDDLAKSPHMARISNSVFRNICPGDPQCFMFGFDAKRRPTKMMEESMLYRMHSHGRGIPLQHGREAGKKGATVKVNGKLFESAFDSKYGLVRIFKILDVDEGSRAWLADPANRACDRPGSWYCPGRYPPVEGLEPPKSHANIDYEKNAAVEHHDLA